MIMSTASFGSFDQIIWLSILDLEIHSRFMKQVTLLEKVAQSNDWVCPACGEHTGELVSCLGGAGASMLDQRRFVCFQISPIAFIK